MMHVVADTQSRLEPLLKDRVAWARRHGQPTWLTYQLDVPPVNAYQAVARAGGFAWLVHPGDGPIRLGIGQAQAGQWVDGDGWQHIEQWTARLQKEGLDESWIVGGQAFAPHSSWPGVPGVFFAVPLLQIEQTATTTRLRIAVRILPEDTWESHQKTLTEAFETVFADSEPAMTVLPAPLEVHFSPSADRWKDLVSGAVAAIRQHALDKVVLARTATLRYADPLDIAVVLHHLRDQNPDATVFLIRWGERVFLGATPELLVRVDTNRQLHTMCLAGSTPRGLTPEEDHRLADDLLNNAKNRREHALVRDHIISRLAPLTASLSAAEIPSIKRLPTVQHLWTPVKGTLLPQVSGFSAVAALHPTPAVAGTPVAQATQYILQHEPFTRGWYAGPIGWADLTGQGEWWVSLRSAYGTARTMTLFAGCGIVEDSDPDLELAESRWKMTTMLTALELEGEALHE